MGNIFSADNSLGKIMGRIYDLIVLNVLWLLFSVPVITMGAATTAMYSVTIKMARNVDAGIIKDFWKSFKRNFLEATILWVIIVIIMGVLVVNLYLCWFIPEQMSKILVWVLGFAIFFVLGMSNYALPMLAVFEVKLGQLLKNSAILVLLKLPYTIALVIFSLLPAAIAIFVTPGMMGLFFTFVIGVALFAFTSSFLLLKVFRKLMPEDQRSELDSYREPD